MVLRGQPVGEQGAADRWTALDPYVAGSGAAPPFFFLHIVQPRAPWGPFFMPRGPATERRIPWPPVCGPDGAIHIGSGAGRRLPVVEESALDYRLSTLRPVILVPRG